MLPTSDSIAHASLRSELPSGEALLWSGRPGGSLLTASDVKNVLGSLASLSVFAFAAFGFLSSGIFGLEIGAPSFELLTDWIFSPYGAILLPLVLYGVFGHYVTEAARRRNTFYGVAHDRLVISSGLLRRNTRSLDIRSLSDIRLDEKPDGSGTISFGAPEEQPKSWWGNDVPRPVSPGFERIPDARRVYETIRTAQRQALER